MSHREKLWSCPPLLVAGSLPVSLFQCSECCCVSDAVRLLLGRATTLEVAPATRQRGKSNTPEGGAVLRTASIGW